MNLLHQYFEIQQIRFQGRLEIIEDIQPDVLPALIPNLILQPLVENAVKHGFSHMDKGGRIEVRAWRRDENLCIQIQDNGPGPPGGDGTLPLTPGVGLKNTMGRLEGLYGENHRLSFTVAEPSGLLVELVLPFYTQTDLYTAEVEPALES